MAPMTHADEARAAMRAGITLASDRLVRKQTRDNRHQLLAAFAEWLWQEHCIDWNVILARKPIDAEEVSNWLSLYGRDLHASGRSYGKYSETINAVAMIRPILKKQLGGAWDIAFSWLLDEPYEHHPALPASILISLVTIGLLWGWPRESALFSLGWAGLLRVGEILNAKRSDLVLPEESAPGINYVLLRLEEPKTRGRSARHQAARIEPRDLVLLISAVFGSLNPSEKLWKMSSATLRKRFSQLLSGLGILPRKAQGQRGYDLASLRPGGATHLLNITEDAELVKRRGRWATTKVMNIYLQEIAVATGLEKLSPETRARVDRLCAIFPQVLHQVLQYLKFNIPCTAWPMLFRHHQRPGSLGKDGFAA